MDEPDTIKALQAQMEELLKQLNESKQVLAPIEDEVIKINAEEFQLKTAFNEQMARVAERKAAALKKKQDAQFAIQQMDFQASKIANEIKTYEQEKAAKKAEEERLEREAAQYMALNERFEKATLAAPWRELAKDHQIQAGHKIVRDRNVILADAMGLGKTLSSIITADMAQKGTSDVTPEFPILGEEKEFHIPPKTVWTDKALQAAKDSEWPFGTGPLASQLSVVPGITPFDTTQYRVGASAVKAGSMIPYLNYDLKNRLINEGFIENIAATTEVKIVNAIERPVGRKILYFCPAPLLRNVLEEWRMWSPHRSVTYIGKMSKAERNFALSFLPKLDEYVIIVNYEAWRRDKALLEELGKCQFDTVIIDEAHNIKDMKSQAYKGVEQVIETCKPEYIIPMTGTPILNRPQEIFPLLHLVNPEEFVNERTFLARYCEEYYPPDIDGNTNYSNPKWRFKPGGLDALLKKISKNILRRTKDQAGIKLPEKAIIYHDIERDDETYPKQAEARESMKKFATLVINKNEGKAIQATVMIALIMRLRQIETWPAAIKNTTTIVDEITGEEREELLQLDVQESQKIDYVIRFDPETQEWEGLIPDNVEDERMVVFSQFKAPLHVLKERIERMGKRCVIIDGDTPDAVRNEASHDFDRRYTPDRKDSKWDVALCNYKAAGVGLNLTAATNMVILDSEWNPGKAEQAYDRLHRMGQTENVTINVLSVQNTIDAWLDQMMKDKASIVDGFDKGAANISANDLLQAMESGLI